MADCTERTLKGALRPPNYDRWRHECLCPHGRLRGIESMIDPVLSPRVRERILALMRKRVHAMPCEDNHPEPVTDG